jgi:hypothetical protein
MEGAEYAVSGSGRNHRVEFTTLDGNTFAVVTVLAGQVRPTQARELAHARLAS